MEPRSLNIPKNLGRFSSSLNRRIASYVLLFSSLSAIVFAGFDLYFGYTKGLAEVENTVEHIRKVHGPNIELKLWELNESDLDLQIEGILNYQTIAHVEVRGSGLRSLKVGKKPLNNFIEHEIKLYHRNQTPVVEIGQLKLHSDYSILYGQLIDRLKFYFFSGLAKTGVLALVLFSVFHLMLTRHIIRLDRYLKAFVGKFSKIPEKKQDGFLVKDDHKTELTDLVGSINHLIKELQLYARVKEENELRLNSLNEELRAKIALLGQAEHRLGETLKVKTDLLNHLSHELRTPLTSIVGHIELIKITNNSPQTTQHLDEIAKTADYLTALINDILDEAKIEQSTLDHSTTAFSPRDLMNSCISMLQSLANQKGLHISSRDLSKHERVSADETKIKQIIINLLSNAIKFTDIGEITVSVYTFTDVSDRAKLVFVVKDSGKGIAEENFRKVFEEFGQAMDGFDKGTGLGLAIVKKYCKQMGGKVELESTVGVGSKFTVTIPVHVKKKINQSLDLNETTILPLSSLKVLVVDDNETNLGLISSIFKLRAIGHDLAKSYTEALSLIAVNHYDIVFTDINLNGEFGYDLARSIRLKLESPPPIIAVTAASHDEVWSKCVDSGIKDYLAKPFHIKNVYAMLKKHHPQNKANLGEKRSSETRG